MRADPPGWDLRPGGMLSAFADALKDRYRLEREIGRGGSAFVFLARDLRDDHQVALKTLRPELTNAVSVTRFLREVEIARTLRHPHMVELLDSGAENGVLFYTMPFIQGESLRERIRREKQLPIDDALRITNEVAGAIDHAHAAGIVHRDIKPGNILLDGGRALVADFGIARAMTVAAGQTLTDSGIAIGTPEYMSPEQGTAERILDPRMDIYSLGCVVYEMLAGEPPFTGPTAQAIIARHTAEAPRSIKVIRDTVTNATEVAIEKALAKVPADRYERASDFARALEAGARTADVVKRDRLSRRARVGVAAAALALLSVAAYALWPRPTALDHNRIVVFPLAAPAAAGREAGEGVATYIGYALEGTRPLKWLDGWQLMSEAQRSAGQSLANSDAARIARAAGAEFFIDGSIIARPDSATVVLRLYNVLGDSLVRRSGASAPIATASLPLLGLSAITDLLQPILAPGRSVDVAALNRRQPAAIARFLQGERDFARMSFVTALDHYQAAVRLDSGFALAALRGAAAANWAGETGVDRELARVALRGIGALSPALAAFARGLDAYLSGAADSAIAHLRAALALDSATAGVETVLAETYLRLLPDEANFDSLGRAALRRARERDRDFAPALLLLQEIALRDGDITLAARLDDELRHAGADTSHRAPRRVMASCLANGPTSVDWQQEVRRDERGVLMAGKILSGRSAQPACAVAAFQALVASDGVSESRRWGALQGLHALGAATGRPDLLASTFEIIGPTRLPLGLLQLSMAVAGAGFERDAPRIADSLGTDYAKMTPGRLYAIGSYEARRDSAGRLEAIVRAVESKRDSSRLRRDSLIARALEARLALARRDTTLAIRMLRALRPMGTRTDMAWQSWAALGHERLTLATLLFARGEHSEAIRVASLLDSTEPVDYPLFLRPSLTLRREAARALNDRLRAVAYERRLAQLDLVAR